MDMSPGTEDESECINTIAPGEGGFSCGNVNHQKAVV